MLRVTVRSKMLRWARERVGRSVEDFGNRFKKLAKWESGDVKPTLKQLEAYARATYVPIGYFFLPEPPAERVPIPDFRTVRDEYRGAPSPNMLDTIYLCQQRQAWYGEYARTDGLEPLKFVGCAKLSANILKVAARIRKSLKFDLDARRSCRTWEDALRQFVDQVDDSGVLVMTSGVVGSNTHRKLDTDEFRGFALADEYAPLIFVNGTDTKSARMFTLAHELAHIWLGKSALTDVSPASRPSQQVEKWCNKVAAELLVPLDAFKEALPRGNPLEGLGQLARRFKVSTLVVLRRILDARRIGWDEFLHAYHKEVARLRALMRKGGGGDPYRTQAARVSKRFIRALIPHTLEGRTLYRDAYRLLSIRKDTMFKGWSRRLGYSR